MDNEVSLNITQTCNECNTVSNVYESDLLPGRDSDGYDDYLIFYVRCPHCYKISEFDDNLIPDKIKLNLMKKYSMVANQVYSIWKLDYEINKLKIKQENLINIKNEILSKRTDNTILFDNWYPSEELIYGTSKKLMK